MSNCSWERTIRALLPGVAESSKLRCYVKSEFAAGFARIVAFGPERRWELLEFASVLLPLHSANSGGTE